MNVKTAIKRPGKYKIFIGYRFSQIVNAKAVNKFVLCVGYFSYVMYSFPHTLYLNCVLLRQKS